jgi:long-subunit fatty acid transport protein
MQQSLSPSFNLGVLWEPNDWFAWGATYQSESRMKLKGNYQVNYTKDWQGLWSGLQSSVFGAFLSPLFPYGNVAQERGVATLKMTNPDTFLHGYQAASVRELAVQRRPQMERLQRLEQSANRVRQGARPVAHRQHLRTQRRDHPQHHPRSRLPRYLSPAFGVQYDVNDRLQLRAGYEYRPSAIPKDKADALVLIGDANLYGLGLGYRWDRDTTIDLASTTSFPSRASRRDRAATSTARVSTTWSTTPMRGWMSPRR